MEFYIILSTGITTVVVILYLLNLRINIVRKKIVEEQTRTIELLNQTNEIKEKQTNLIIDEYKKLLKGRDFIIEHYENKHKTKQG